MKHLTTRHNHHTTNNFRPRAGAAPLKHRVIGHSIDKPVTICISAPARGRLR